MPDEEKPSEPIEQKPSAYQQGFRTPEQRHAASERMRRSWEKRRAKQQGYQESPIVGVTPRVAEEPKVPVVVMEIPSTTKVTGDPWRDLPFQDALDRLVRLEKEVLHARTVISTRSLSLPKVWTCWTALNRKSQANLPGMSSAYNQCKKNIPDGKWVMKDDCWTNKETGLVDPVVVCSQICYTLYQTYRSRLKLKERQGSE